MRDDSRHRSSQRHSASEAETREIPPPDVEGLIRGGRARRRRRNVGRIGVAAAAAVLAGGSAYGVSHLDAGDPGTDTVPPATSESEPAAVPSHLPDQRNMTWIAPGTYRMFVGADPAGDKIEADSDRHELELVLRGPTSGLRPLGDAWAGVGVYQPAHWPALPPAPTIGGPARERAPAVPGPPAGPAPLEHSRSATDSDHSIRPRRPPRAAANRRPVPLERVLPDRRDMNC